MEKVDKRNVDIRSIHCIFSHMSKAISSNSEGKRHEEQTHLGIVEKHGHKP